jgi:hypothetical protein
MSSSLAVINCSDFNRTIPACSTVNAEFLLSAIINKLTVFPAAFVSADEEFAADERGEGKTSPGRGIFVQEALTEASIIYQLSVVTLKAWVRGRWKPELPTSNHHVIKLNRRVKLVAMHGFFKSLSAI